MTIKTHFDNPPISINNMDWSAWDDETLDENSLIGHGSTEIEAIQDLLDQIFENQE